MACKQVKKLSKKVKKIKKVDQSKNFSNPLLPEFENLDSKPLAEDVVSKSSKKSKVKSKVKSQVKSQKIEDLIIEHRESGRKLARSFLRRWRVRMPLDEVDSIVDLALCEAGIRFCEKKGASFMTFFYYHLRGQMVRYVESAVKRGNLLVQFSHTSDLDVTDWAQQGSALSDMFVPESVCNEKNSVSTPEQLYIRQESIDMCRDACKGLDALEQEVLKRSYAKGEALVDIASSLGYSRCHISRVKKKAMIRLKINLQENGNFPTKQENLDDKIEVSQVEKVRKARRRARRGGSSISIKKKATKTQTLKQAGSLTL